VGAYYDLKYIRERIPIQEVAAQLGIERHGKMLRCWRPGHTHGDSTPSMGIDFRRNKVKCFLCDDRQLSNLDLVAEHEGISLQQAAEWIADRFSVPAAGKSKSASARGHYWRSKTYQKLPLWFRPYVEGLVLDPRWSKLPPLPAKIFTILLVLLLVEVLANDKYQVQVSNKDLQELSGRGKNTVLRAIKLLKRKKLINVTRTRGDCCVYEVNTIPRRLVESIIEEKYKKESKA
jgi:hypothetical protein